LLGIDADQSVRAKTVQKEGIAELIDDDTDLEWHTQQVAKAARQLFQAGGVLEQSLDACLLAAQHEWLVQVVVTAPAKLRIDGGDVRPEREV
jgi:hypothetical protein